MKPLDGFDVLDLTQSIAGPISTQLLGSMGANVVKIEPPNGDAFRELLEGAMFASANLGGKRSVSIDLKTDEGQEIAGELAEKADVIVQSFRPGVVDRFGLDYESVREVNEDVVYCSLSGFGQDGPRADWPAYDPVIQAMSGLMSTIGYPDRSPVRIGASIIDYSTGTMAAFLVVSSLLKRAASGGGEHIDIAMFDVAVSWMGYWAAHYLGTGEVVERSGQGFAGLAPNEVFMAAEDEPFYMCVVNDRLYERLCRAIDREDLITAEKYSSNAARWENRQELSAELQAEFETYDRDELTVMLAEAGVPTGPLQSIDEVVDDDPHVKARELFTPVENIFLDKEVKTVGSPYILSGDRPPLGNRPPELGEHTREVLQEAGFSAAEIDEWIAQSVVLQE